MLNSSSNGRSFDDNLRGRYKAFGACDLVDPGTWHVYQLPHLMSLLRHRSFRVLCALVAFVVFTGDIVADAIHDASGACATESQDGGHDSCPACACPTHTGSVISPDAIALHEYGIAASQRLPITDDQPAVGVAPAIDHPPQLA